MITAYGTSGANAEDRSVAGTQDLNSDSYGLADVQVQFMAGSEVTKNLYLGSPNTQRLLWYALVKPGDDDVHGDAPGPERSFVVGPAPGNVALKP